MKNYFDLSEKIIVITGGAGLLGIQHAEAVAEAGGIPILIDVKKAELESAVESLRKRFGAAAKGYNADITDEKALKEILASVYKDFKSMPYGLVNNAAIDPKFDLESSKTSKSRIEHFQLEQWERELRVGLTGAFLCAKIFGTEMARSGKGVIVNISSDLGIIAPDQRLYRKENLSDEMQEVKPVTYSVIKHGLIGLTKYLATYWADRGIRCNALAPSGVYNGHTDDFVKRISSLIPLGRMALKNEYKPAIQFLLSDASSYMTGAVLVIDGGRSCW